MADAVAPGDGAEEAAEGAAQATAGEQTDETAETVEVAEPGEDTETDTPSAAAEPVEEPEPAPRDGSDAASEAGAEAEVKVAAGSAAAAEAEAEAAADGEGEPEAEPEPEAESEPEAELAGEPEPGPASEAASEPEPEPEPVPAAVSFVPPPPSPPSPLSAPSEPSQPAAERATVVLAGRRIDRRAALIAGGVGVVVIGGAVAAMASSGGSSASADTSTGHQGAGATGKASSAPSIPLPTITTNPADGASGVDPSKPITVKVFHGTIASVQLSGEEQTNGTLSTDGSTWTSDNSLNVNTSYQLSITAKNSAGKTKSATVSFRTLKPSATFGVSSVVPPRGSTVGVGQPIRVTFSNYVPAEYKAALEQACVVRTSPPVAGAWYWVSNSTNGAILDWRPKDFWPVDTKVSVDFNLNGVRLGAHQFGVKNYSPHNFSIRDTDLRLIVDKDKFSATCYRNGKAIRTFPIDTGVTSAETFVTYTGTMAVLGKGNPVEMKGNYGPNDTYDDFVNWATQITWSGTYVHAAPWDPEIGHANDDSHGCVHCRTSDAEWFYNIVHTGDVVTIKGRRKRPVAVSNGICTFTLDWADLLKGSAYGATVNGKPTTA